MCPNPCDEWRERPLYWSTIGYLRTWWATDGAWVSLIEREGGMTPELLSAIAKEYFVHRNIVGGVQERASNITNICRMLNCKSRNWPSSSLIERAELCDQLTTKMHEKEYTRSREFSGLSKFMWFIKPYDWTMYDKFATYGLNIAGSENADKFKCFYKKLHHADFSHLVENMQREIENTEFKGLPATRIVDTLLMARGGRGGDTFSVSSFEAFLQVLPSHTSCNLVSLAQTLQRRFGDHPLASPNRPDRQRRGRGRQRRR